MRISTISRIFLWCMLTSLVLAGTLDAQQNNTSSMWNQIQRWKHGVDPMPPAVLQPVQGGEATMNPLTPPNTPDIQVFNPSNFWQSENSIGVNFSNGNQLMISTNGQIPITPVVVEQTWAFSTDGGATWPASLQSENVPPTITDSYGDPVAFFDRSGRAYYVTLSPSGIFVVSTTNFGGTWSAQSNADNLSSGSDDKEHAAADYSGTFPNNVYVAWTDFAIGSAPVQFNRSTNQGASWGSRQTLAIGSNRGQGTHIAIGPDGEVYVFWADYTGGTAEVGIGMAKSTDGGATFSTPAVAFPINGTRTSNSGIPALNGTRGNSFPYVDVDRSNGPRRGWVYSVTPELDVANTGQSDVYVRRSTNGGGAWSSAIRVNGPDVAVGRWQFMPSIAVDPTTGGITVSYYSFDSTGNTTMVNRYAAYSADGGSTWDNFVISDVRALWSPQGTPNTNTVYNGDYYETAAMNGKAWPCWTDRRLGSAGTNNRAYIQVIQYSENFGWVDGIVTNVNGGTPVEGVNVDFVESLPQQASITDTAGFYFAGVQVDTPGTTANLTLRGRKFGFVDTTVAVVVTRFDTLTQNFQIRPAPSGTLLVRARTPDSSAVRANVRVHFGSLEVVNDFTDSVTGDFSTSLPAGTYDVTVDPPSPLNTNQYDGTVIVASQTTTITSVHRAIVENSPAEMRDTLAIGQLDSKTLTLTNTSSDSVPWRLSTEGTRINNSPADLKQIARSKEQQSSMPLPKGAVDTRTEPASPNGQGGPDAFGYVWIDSDEPGGPTYNFVDIRGVGTQITGLADDTNLGPFAIGFSFPFYENSYTQFRICSNGFMSFTSTSSTFSNSGIPSSAEPNNALYPFWDDLLFSAGSTAWYYYDSGNNRCIIQWDSVAFYSGAGTNTFQVILKPGGEMLFQYRSMGTATSATVGIENAAGDIALQTVLNAAYLHNEMAVLYKLRGVDWLSYNPNSGVLAPSSSQNVSADFNATGLTVGTTYSANTYLDVTHPDVQGSTVIPTSLRVQLSDSAVLILSATSVTFPTTRVNFTSSDSVTARNGGLQTLNISSITSTYARFAVTPSSAILAPNDSVVLHITYEPLAPGSDTGHVVLVSNSFPGPYQQIALSGTAIGVPDFLVRLDSLVQTLDGGNMDSIQFYMRNDGTGDGDFAAHAIMYPNTRPAGRPIMVPMKVHRAVPKVPRTGAATVVDGPTADRSPYPSSGSAPNPQNSLAQFDLQFDYDANAVTSAAGNAGAIFIPTLNEFWTSRWATNVLHRWDANGNLIEQFTVAGVTGTRGMTFDGQYIYASTNSSTINKIDPVTKTLVGTIICQGGVTTRMISYDPVRDGFWTSNFAGNISLVERTGAVTATITSSLVAKYGSAYDPYTPGGPYLWVFDQTNTAGGVPQNVYQIDLNTLTFTGFAFDILTRITTGGTAPIAGGLFIATGLVPGKATIGGLLQGGGTGADDRLFGLELADAVSSGNWFTVAPTSGTITMSDSVLMTAYFDATDPVIYNNPGDYFGQLQVNATNSPLADTLRVPAHLFVVPPVNPTLVIDRDSINFGSVEIGSADSSQTVLARNIGQNTLNVSNIAINNADFTVSPTSFSLTSLDTMRLTFTFNSQSPPGLKQGTATFVSNDSSAPQIGLYATSFGLAHITVAPDTFFRFLQPNGDTTRTNFTIRNPGTDTLHYAIAEYPGPRPGPGTTPVAQPVYESYTLPKGAVDPHPGIPPQRINGTGGPDAFGYIWIDSDEPGGPQYNWVDIKAVGTQISGLGDDTNLGPFPIGFDFPFYGNTYNSIRVCSNGWVSFTSTSTSYSNLAIPSAAEPNNAVYPFWDDLNFSIPGGTAWYYYDAANNRFIIQYDSVSFYSGTGTNTFEVILRPGGDILVQYRSMTGTVSSSTVGIENLDGSIGLQVVFNAPYIHNNLATLYSRDVSWMSTNITEGSLAPADSQSVELRYHPEGMTGGDYDAHLRISGNTTDVRNVAVHLRVEGVPTVTVTSPNGGEQWVQGTPHSITWNKQLVDSVKIEYSTAGSGGPWTLITAGVPARPTPVVHPKLASKYEEGGITEMLGTFDWLVPNTPSANCFVRISDKANGATFDTSNAHFTILAQAPPETSWTVQTSPTTQTLYSVKAVSQNVGWIGGAAGTVIRTTDGTTWTNAGPAGVDPIYTISALNENFAMAGSFGSFAKIWRTTNGGATWTVVDSIAGGFPDYVHIFDANNAYWMGDPVAGNWLLRRTTDGGNTWTNAATVPANPSTEAGWNNSMFWLNTTTGWYGTNSNHAYKTTDGGATWTAYAHPAVNSYATWFNSATFGAIGSEANFNVSTDGGLTWAVAGALANTIGATGVPGGQEFWAVNQTGNVSYSSNGGTSWTTAGPNGNTGSGTLYHINFMTVGANVYGWAVGPTGTIRHFLRIASSVAGTVAEVPTVFALDQNYPNPFNPTTTIRYALPVQSKVTLKVFNILGQEVMTLIDGDQNLGFYQVVWDGRNEVGSAVASGIYFFRIDAAPANGDPHFVQIKKMLMIK